MIPCYTSNTVKSPYLVIRKKVYNRTKGRETYMIYGLVCDDVTNQYLLLYILCTRQLVMYAMTSHSQFLVIFATKSLSAVEPEGKHLRYLVMRPVMSPPGAQRRNQRGKMAMGMFAVDELIVGFNLYFWRCSLNTSTRHAWPTYSYKTAVHLCTL